MNVLRSIGQAYFLLRLLCFSKATVRTLSHLPCQGIIDGSVLPIGCYLRAHLIDSPMKHQYFYGKLVTNAGLYGLVRVH
ncbi:TPA: hypothetical protein N0F65_005562 [Lagenidium giganteum]|uniref:Secreted protein n=1 Tax=Lagenidium giganteum TaxID=4803 RepID=A0AAV2YU17_9STRA|nr:TPA: hypothetical protein N0F65_005562 [Lagenidium giganteum]